MTEKINVAVKMTLNRVRAVIALIFWIIVGVIGFVYINEGPNFFSRYRYSQLFGGHNFNYLSLLPLFFGIIIGIIRLFVINDKFAWQVATLEEIRELRKMVDNLKISKPSQGNISSNTTSTPESSSEIKSEDVWVCTNCGETNPSGTKFCQKCGK